MKHPIRQTDSEKAIKHRNVAYGVAGILIVSNVLLSIKAFNHAEKWVLIPQFDIADRLMVHGERYSDEYLQNWAGGLAQTLLTANPATIDRVIHSFLEVSSSQYGQIKHNVEAYGKDIKENHVSTTFYAKSFKIDRKNKEIEVTGEFLTWFGREKLPVSETKTFCIGWIFGPKGVLLVNKFEERKAQ